MTSLMDTIKTEMGGPAAKPKPELGTTNQISKLLAAKSGKAMIPGASGPRQSALGERIAARETELGQKALGEQATITGEQQAQQSADITQRSEQQDTRFEEQRATQRATFDRQANTLLDNFIRDNKVLETSKDIQNIEQVGAGLRLNNKKYIDNLQMEGQKSRLDDKLEFKAKLAQDIFADSEDLLMSQYSFDTIMKADDREFAEEIGKIDAAAALDMASKEIDAANAQAKWGAVAGAVDAGVKAVATYKGSGTANITESTGITGETMYTDTSTGQQMDSQGQDMADTIGQA